MSHGIKRNERAKVLLHPDPRQWAVSVPPIVPVRVTRTFPGRRPSACSKHPEGRFSTGGYGYGKKCLTSQFATAETAPIRAVLSQTT